MDKRQITLKLVCDAVGIKVSISSFDDRLILQKAIYLTQLAGVDLGYSYNWYLRGPYSPALAQDAFETVDEIKRNNDSTEGWSLHEDTISSLEPLRRIVEAAKEHSENDLARKLELLASLAFLKCQSRCRSMSIEKLRDELERHGKKYSVAEVEWALQELRKNELIPG